MSYLHEMSHLGFRFALSDSKVHVLKTKVADSVDAG